MIKFTEKLYKDLIGQLHKMSLSGEDGYELAKQQFHIAETTMIKLKEFISDYSFKTKEEEIRFFKEIKPMFHRELLFYIELIHIESHKPVNIEKEVIKSYYRQICDRLQMYLSKQNVMYLYYRTKRTTEDEILFLRENDCVPMVPEDSVDLDKRFSTVAGSLFARMMAFERLLIYLGREIEQLDVGQALPGEIKRNNTIWTHSKVSLIELAYAIHAAGCVNFGKADVKQIIESLEIAFGIELGNFYRVFQSIRIRQSNRTAFLDEMKSKLETRMDQFDIGLN